MSLIFIILWVLLVSLTTIFGSLYARRYNRPDGLIALYISLVIFSNFVASKVAAYHLGFTFFAPAAALFFPVTFLLTDIVNERFGRKETQRMIFLTLVCQVMVGAFSYLSLSLPAAPFWQNQEAFTLILGQVPRVILASWISFFVSENLDAYIFDWFRRITGGKYIWMRNAFSSLPAMLVDSVIFVTLAFYGTTSLWPLIFGVTALKWLTGLIDIPFMYLNRFLLNYKKQGTSIAAKKQLNINSESPS